MSTVFRPIKFGILGFAGGGGGGKPDDRRKSVRARTRTNNKLNPHVMPSPGINPGHGGGRQALSPQSYPCSRSLLLCKGQNESSELTTTGSIILEKTVHTDNFSIFM